MNEPQRTQMDAEKETIQESMNMAPVVAAKRRRIGLSLRVLMVVVLLLGGGFGWLAYRARVQRQAVAAIEAAGGTVFYDWDYADEAPILPGKKRPWPNWLIKLVGPDYLGNVTFVHVQDRDGAVKADDGLMAQIGRLDRLEKILVFQTRSVSDTGLAHLKGLTRLQTIHFGQTGITGRGMVNLKGLNRLEVLSLDGNDIADDGLTPIADMTWLKHLNLRSPGITDAGLVHLERLVNLEAIQLRSPFITDASLARLAKLRRLHSILFMDASVRDLRPLAALTELSGLGFFAAPIEDADLIPLAKLRGLKGLQLVDTKITDAGLVHIEGLTNLEVLNLQGNRITDAGLPCLYGLAKCKWLDLSGTAVTPQGIAALQAKLTGATITTKSPPMPPARTPR
jgi:internalin A